MENTIDIKNIDVPNLIRLSQYMNHISAIRNYEDTIHKLFINNKESSLTNNPNICLWKIDSDHIDLFPELKQMDLSIFGMDNIELLNNVMIMGPYVRSCLITRDEGKNIKIRKEIYLYKNSGDTWNDLIDLEEFEDKKNEYLLESDDFKICLVKKRYKNQAHIILQRDYLKRIGWMNGHFYASSMFLIELQKHNKYILSKYKDPIMNIPYDPLEIYELLDNDKMHPLKIIDVIDYEELLKIPKKFMTKLYNNNKTCIEYCLDKFLKEDNHPILLNQLKNIIIYLCGFTYKRPPFLYAKMIGFDKLYPEIYNILKTINNEYDIHDYDKNIVNVDGINNIIYELIIKNDDVNKFNDYLLYLKNKININLINMIVENNSIKIITHLLSNKLLDDHLTYYLILMTENLELINLSELKFDIEIALNYLKDIIEKSKLRSFYFLYEYDKSIICSLFEEKQNILHKIKPYGNYINFIELIMKLKPELIDLKDDNKITPVMYHSINNPIILNTLLNYDFDFTLTDDCGNTFFHHLCKNDSIEQLKLVLKKYSELIDIPNNKSETPIILSCIHNRENMFYILKGMGANLDTQDCYGNNVYHYICANAMCLGIIIINDKNNFGLTPVDYCKISHNYYSIQNNE
jgi:hypothetical protein